MWKRGRSVQKDSVHANPPALAFAFPDKLHLWKLQLSNYLPGLTLRIHQGPVISFKLPMNLSPQCQQ